MVSNRFGPTKSFIFIMAEQMVSEGYLSGERGRVHINDCTSFLEFISTMIKHNASFPKDVVEALVIRVWGMARDAARYETGDELDDIFYDLFGPKDAEPRPE